MPARIGEIVAVFLRLGATAFGGPAAHVAMMRRELVTRRGWEDDQTFLDLVGITAVLPGPNSTELAIELGRRRGGRVGLVAAGVAFILPAFAIVVVIAVLYDRYGTTPELADLRTGVLPVVVAIVAHATWLLGRRAIRGALTAAIAVVATVAALLDVHDLLILAGGAAATVLWSQRGRLGAGAALALAMCGRRVAEQEAVADLALPTLFWSFLRIGATLFGSGYVLVAMLESEFVERLGVLTDAQLLDAVSVGQVTPGPVFTTATFVGHVLAGVPGAVVASVAIFLPAFVLVAALGGPLACWLRRPAARVLLDGLNAAALGLIAAACIALAGPGIDGPLGAALAAAALAVLVWTDVNATWLVAAGLTVGLARLAGG